ncbi:LacI family DNA-binding transcriptional regulator [Salinisphaera sp. Q1T1-3]|uniref:LacI family DNA-binding transcriptional regulator n=1 Tax=Salinisphaera sp. Q1T1-3 TaxID=2321229 RepID=UPI000E7382A9|nr:LacI family DNA-binding transcriptional regulator [Salinisphaera sp. Q1T1-3]RJS93146.1 LacI family transcriptional regulator [Salinisphaera sp. Q1T1-3]
MSSIREVARLAGVSVATVSRTLKKPDVVSPKTRERVLAAVDKADYHPNRTAIQFRAQKTQSLVVLVPTIANTFYARVISGIQQAAQRFGYAVLLCHTQGDEQVEARYAALVSARQADGVIQLRAHDPFPATATSQRWPMVNACEVLDDPPCPSIRLDNRTAAREMTEHLIALGHRHIAMIKGPRRSPLTRDRADGYRDALARAGITHNPSWIQPGDFTPQSGYAGARALIERTDRPTALFCESDEMAIGALHYLKHAGLRVPHDISLAGFDDIEFARYCDPPLTTISQPAEAFGEAAVEMLIATIDGQEIDTSHRTMPHRLLIRASTGPVG